MPYQKVTMIDDLPEIDSVDMPPQAQPMSSQYVSTKIRPSSLPMESGMSNYNLPPRNGNYMIENNAYGQQPQFDNTIGNDYRPYAETKTYEPYGGSHCDCNCQHIYEHVKNCDICKRFYNPSTTHYLLMILILIIACALMAKKLMNV